MHDLDGRRWVPRPKYQYRITKVFKQPNMSFDNLANIELGIGDIVSFNPLTLPKGEYIRLSYIYDSTENELWDSHWEMFVENGEKKTKVGVLAYTAIARLFSDVASIKYNWDKSFDPFTEETLDQTDTWQYERAMEHFFPNFLVEEI